MGIENFNEIEETIKRYGIDCSFERTGEMNVATEPWQVEEMHEVHTIGRELGMDIQYLDQDEVRAEVNSPTYIAGVWERGECAMIDPARLAWGLRQACLKLGVRMFEHSPVREISTLGPSLQLKSVYGTVRARRVALGTGCFSPLLRRLKYYVVPVYDYALMTEPLSQAQLDSIGWKNRQGMGDSANQFHYYRLTDDNSILWGGYDAVYYNGGQVRPNYDQRDTTFTTLAEHFYETFPPTGGRAVLPQVGRRHRHVQPVLGLLRHRVRHPPRLRRRLHGPRRGGDQVRRQRHARPASTAATPSGPDSTWSARSRCRSRPNPSGRE